MCSDKRCQETAEGVVGHVEPAGDVFDKKVSRSNCMSDFHEPEGEVAAVASHAGAQTSDAEILTGRPANEQVERAARRCALRSEERRVGDECVSTCSSRLSRYPSTIKSPI